MRDKDLDSLLSEYRNEQPTDLQIQKWKRIVHLEVRTCHEAKKNNSKIRFKSPIWLQLVAASLIGFLLGALAFSQSPNEDQSKQLALAQFESADATIEYVYTKSD